MVVKDLGIGAGPRRLLANAGAHARVVEPPTGATEVGRMFEVQRAVGKLAARWRPGALRSCCPVNATRRWGRLGIAATGRVGVVWFDAHADMNAPETTSPASSTAWLSPWPPGAAGEHCAGRLPDGGR